MPFDNGLRLFNEYNVRIDDNVFDARDVRSVCVVGEAVQVSLANGHVLDLRHPDKPAREALEILIRHLVRIKEGRIGPFGDAEES